jgi:hypothetical protein
MATGKTGLQQRVGYFNTQNGVYLQQKDGVLSFVIRSYTSGAVVETVVQQSNWNGDKLNGTGSSGITIDVTKTQILYIDLEWLGVGAVRCGLVLNGNYVLCHTFYNANNQSYVYMTTAVLPVRYEITNTAVTSGASTLQQICSTVISEGGYEQTSQEYYARNTTAITVGTTFQPLVSIRLNSSKLGAVVIPARIAFLPIGTGNYEIALIKNGVLTGASWVTGTFSNVDYDISSTAMTYTAANIAQIDYATSSNQAQSSIIAPTGYNFELQIGTSLAGVSDVWTLAARTLAATNTCIGSLAFWDLTL